MNYAKHYDLLIDRARNRLLECYTERHHIVPKCIGGSDLPENIIDLTAEEHYVAHQLLIKIYPGYHKLIYAAKMMTVGSKKHGRTTNKLYGWLKRKASKASSIDQKGKVSPLRGRKQNPEHVKKRILPLIGKKRPQFSKEWIRNMSKAHKGKQTWNKGKTMGAQSPEHIKKRIQARMKTIRERKELMHG